MKRCLPVLILAYLLTGCGIFFPVESNTPLPVTITPIRLPTITPTATVLPTSTPLPPTPTVTPLPTSTPEPTASPLPTETPEPLLQAQPGSPRFLPAFLHADEGCAWRGVAGQVFAADGQGMAQAVILVTGEVQGQAAEFIVLSAAESDYGPGGYEIAFAGIPAEENLSFTIQVLDLQGNALSAPFSIQMPAACDQNLALVSFQPDGGT